MQHSESWRGIGAVELQEGEGYHNVTVEVTTLGGVSKLITLSESEASWLGASISTALGARNVDTRTQRFKASMMAGGRPAPLKGEL